ncbi:hypothetical protein ACSSS7_000863 [Eimeria intestinalis]
MNFSRFPFFYPNETAEAVCCTSAASPSCCYSCSSSSSSSRLPPQYILTKVHGCFGTDDAFAAGGPTEAALPLDTADSYVLASTHAAAAAAAAATCRRARGPLTLAIMVVATVRSSGRVFINAVPLYLLEKPGICC